MLWLLNENTNADDGRQTKTFPLTIFQISISAFKVNSSIQREDL